MKLFLLLFLAAAATASTIHDGDIFDLFDIKKILDTDDLRQAVFGCLVDRNPCDEYQLIKDRTPAIIKTACADCTPKQRAMFEKYLKQFEVEHNDEYKQLLARYLQ